MRTPSNICRHCDGHGHHEVWAMSPAEPVRLYTCLYCHGRGNTVPVVPAAQMRLPFVSMVRPSMAVRT